MLAPCLVRTCRLFGAVEQGFPLLGLGLGFSVAMFHDSGHRGRFFVRFKALHQIAKDVPYTPGSFEGTSA